MTTRGPTLVSHLVGHVRDMLQDADKDRYTDERLIQALNLGVLQVRRKRPDYFIGTYHVATELYVTMTEQVSLPDDVLLAVIDYAIGWVEMAEDEYSTDGRAVAMLKQFSEGLEQ